LQTPAPPQVPSLSQLVRDGRADAIQHGRRTREGLKYWLRQSERLHVARTRHGLSGGRFVDFARRIGIDRATAFQLVKLQRHHDAVLSDCQREEAEAVKRGEAYYYPGWRAVLERYEGNTVNRRPGSWVWRGAESARLPPRSSIPEQPSVTLYQGDTLSFMRTIALPLTADVCITSPPYFRKFDYGTTGQYGLEASVQEYLRVQVAVFHEVQRHLRVGGTCFIVVGDTSNNYSPVRAKSQRKGGNKQWRMRRSLEPDYREKETLNIPFRLVEALRRDGWIHRATLVWDKIGGSGVPNSDSAPECHEYILHMIKWPGKRQRPYGNTRPLKSSVLRHQAVAHPRHGCVFPVSLAEELLSVCPPKPIIIDPYIGSGTVAVAARKTYGSVVHGFDLDCSVAIRSVPGAALLRSTPYV
jgi:DNA modification methylase